MSLILFLILGSLSSPAACEEWSVDPSTGYFRVILLKEGLLAGLGHDHVIDARDVRGEISIADSSSSVRLEINAAGAEIDSAASRSEEGFAKEVGESDRVKIRANMRGPKGLDVQRYPMIKFDSASIERVESLKGLWMVSGAFALHGSTGTLEFPVTLSERPGGYWASGYVRIRPSDYGIKPFSVMGGLIKVQDEALVKFNLGLRALGSVPGR
ncbi:MAG: YceI family protein [Elusimicrobia bacterium]|nr:YceI family protein [Elusimicrobiota bacterium]